MPDLESLAAADVANVVRAFRNALAEHVEAINRLNVYPVPDGDTGTNMLLTMGSVVNDLDQAVAPGAELSMADVAGAMSHGSLMGARGNSGVILSQILRGMAGALKAAGDHAGPRDVEAALVQGADSAYAAVSNPVEGTILSVAGAAAHGAMAAGADADLATTLEMARQGAAEALARTPQQLPVLKAAGVVDAGGAGLLLLMDSFLLVVEGKQPQAPPEPARGLAVAAQGDRAPASGHDRGGAGAAARAGAGVEAGAGSRGGAMGGARARAGAAARKEAGTRAGGGAAARKEAGTGARGEAAAGAAARGEAAAGTGEEGEEGEGPGEPGVAELRYEVMFLLEVADEAVPAFRRVWASYGGSIVIVGGDGLYNCHIHTDDIGGAIEAAIEIGRPRRIRVTDLHEQVQEERWVREAAAAGQPPEPPAEPVTCAVVAVGAGDGIGRIFASLGAAQVVKGGQSANPSTAEILAAIEAAPAEQVIVLPNNPNVVAVAEQAVAHTTKKARVVPTPGVPEGFAALLAYDPEADLDTNAEAMDQAAARVAAGEVAQATRAASTQAGPVQPGDWLGLTREGIRVVAPQPSGAADAAIALLSQLVADGPEIVTIIEGEGAHAAETRRIAEWLAEKFPDLTVEVHHGGQPLYPFVFSIE